MQFPHAQCAPQPRVLVLPVQPSTAKAASARPLNRWSRGYPGTGSSSGQPSWGDHLYVVSRRASARSGSRGASVYAHTRNRWGQIGVVLMLRARQWVFAALALVYTSAFALPSQVSSQASSADQLQVPAPAAVALDANTTTFLAIDFLQSTCTPNPSCINTLPAVSSALATARAAGAHVVYSVHLAPDNNILADVAPALNDPIFAAIPGDKFFDSNLDYLLRQAGTTTLILTGFSSNSGVMYTAAAAVQRGYTVVVAQDGIAAATDFATTVALWQLLHGPGANPQNAPLQAKAITLSQTNLITYQ